MITFASFLEPRGAIKILQLVSMWDFPFSKFFED